MLITEDTRQGIASLLGGLGVLVLIFGIFLDLDFGLALVIAVFLWLLTDVFKTWVKIDQTTNTNKFNNRKAFVKLLSILGVWVIIFSIFTISIRFELAIVIAVALFIFSGIFSEFFGVSEPRQPRRRYTSNPLSTPLYKKADFESFNEQEPAKYSCNNCGALIDKNDVFCSECGERI
jgi:hypothetical protein